MNAAPSSISSSHWRTLSLGAAVSLGIVVIRLRCWRKRRATDDGTNLLGSSAEVAATQGDNQWATKRPDGTNAGLGNAMEASQCIGHVASKGFQQGDRVSIDGLQARPELNGQIGVLGRFFAEKGRWAVQLETGAKVSSEPLLVRPDSLHHLALQPLRTSGSCVGISSSPDVLFAGRRIRFFGIGSYASAEGGDEVYNEIVDCRPGVILMESFNAGEDVAVGPGDEVPYRDILPKSGVARAMERISDAEFRAQVSAETVAVLAALRVGVQVRLGDRLHVTSFDRLINNHSLDDLKSILGQAMEAIAGSTEASGDTLTNLKQNSLCPHFQELGRERHSVMAHFARKAAEQGHDVLFVVGAEHVGEVRRIIVEGPTNAETLLQGVSPDSESEALNHEELEKRCAMAAFLNTTRTFPPEMVLPPREELAPEYGELAAKWYPKYREAFNGRLQKAVRNPGQPSADARGRVRGLDQLHQLCREMDSP